MTTPKPIQFTEEERYEICTSTLRMYGKVSADKNTPKETVEFWWNAAEKLRKARVWENPL